MIGQPKATRYFEEILEIHNEKNIAIFHKYLKLRNVLEQACRELSKDVSLQFSNLFSRLSFICDKYNLDKRKTYQVHSFRITANKVLHENLTPSHDQYLTNLKGLTEALSHFFQTAIPSELIEHFPEKEYYKPRAKPTDSWLNKLRVEFKRKEGENLICHSESAEFADEIIVKTNKLALNDKYTRLGDFWDGAQLYLLNIRIDADGYFYPMHIILEPDYLLDITSIAECFQDYGVTELHFLKSKFEGAPNSKYIRLGNFANLVIDELFSEKPDAPKTFKQIFKKDFKAYPFDYTTCDDIKDPAGFKQYQDVAELHYKNLRRVLANDFQSEYINFENACLEPSFFCPQYGIQGRLDILELNKGNSKIVELKSGSTPWPDDGESIKPNHQAQLYLYYQIIGLLNQLDFKEISEKIKGYILYSKVPQNNLRYSKPYRARVQEILNLRNHIIIQEHVLANGTIEQIEKLFAQVNPENLIAGAIGDKFRQILSKGISGFTSPLKGASDLERNYFMSFVNFIAKEQFLAKTGQGEYQSNKGLANLWLHSFPEKQEKFEILYDLQIIDNQICEDGKLIILKRTNESNEFVNFREGDICVLYPRDAKTASVITSQIFKCTISNLKKDFVEVKFRYQQRNTDYFDERKNWALERDFMDSSFISMYRGLFSFIQASLAKRKLLLGQSKPNIDKDYGYKNPELSEEQNRIINKALTAKDYFLLVGPPGTGKTSIILKELVREFYSNPNQNILLLAYTNRAVDEICDAVNNSIINLDDMNDGIVNWGQLDRNFIRIGSKLSCSQKYRHNLLDNISANVNTRGGLKELLNRHRIYIATVASMASKKAIFDLKNFDIVIVDEASQILEPQIIGLLPNAKKFILIGDHKQLPAIVLQNPEVSKTNNDQLEECGLNYRKNSLFERLHKNCVDNRWEWAYDELTFQGRMHQEIALFPNYSFYGGLLKEALQWQKEPLALMPATKKTIEDLLSQKRLAFFPSKTDPGNHFGKANSLEAKLVVNLVQTISALYKKNNKTIDARKTVGVITPYRNQIALIKQKLEEAAVPNFEEITVDTVERFQGSQRDIIILSFSVNTPFELNALVNMSDDGLVDRKLNVALTRAKEQLILIGNDSILAGNLLYYRLIEFIKSKGGYVNDSIENVLKNKFQFQYFDSIGSIESIEGLIYEPDNEFKIVFDTLVIDIIRNDERTQWPHRILGETNDFIRNNVIEYGRTNFNQKNLFAQHFSTRDKVNLYCFYNMRKHYFSSFAVYNSFSEYFFQEISKVSGRTSFIDFGCGPMTSGLAFNQCFKAHFSPQNFNYFGIDISDIMLSKAREFFDSGLFNRNNRISLTKSFGKIDTGYLEDIFSLPNIVLLNFCYFFANINLDQTYELADKINNLVKDYPLNKYVIIYQNPSSDKRNYNYSKFKKRLKKFSNKIVRKSETVSYRNQMQSIYDKSEEVLYEIIST